MTNVTIQSGAIRTLTEEEIGAVSGGLTQQQIAEFSTGNFSPNTNWFKTFQPSYNTYTPSRFFPVVPWVPLYNPVWFGI